MVHKSSMVLPSSGGGGIASINGDTTAAQIIVGGSGISVSSTGGTTTITNTGGSSGITVTPETSGPVTIASGAGLGVYSIYNSSGAGFTVNLPSTPAANQVVTIVDAGLNAAAHNITVQGNGNNISGGGSLGTSYVIGSNGGAVTLAWDGTQWSQIA